MNSEKFQNDLNVNAVDPSVASIQDFVKEHHCLKAGCDGFYVDRGFAFSCEKDMNQPKGATIVCGSIIFKKTYGNAISRNQLKQLLEGEEITMHVILNDINQEEKAIKLKVDKELGRVKILKV